MSIVDELHRAREAYERREWVATYRALSRLGGANLRPDDLMALWTTAYLLGRRNDCVQAVQRAYQAYLDQGETLGEVLGAGRIDTEPTNWRLPSARGSVTCNPWPSSSRTSASPSVTSKRRSPSSPTSG